MMTRMPSRIAVIAIDAVNLCVPKMSSGLVASMY
jgi:hypothetical protein